MPFYEYKCNACGARTEALQKMQDAPLVDCPECGKPALQKIVSAPAFSLKGTGWYATDFKDNNKTKDKQKGETNTVTNSENKKEGNDHKAGNSNNKESDNKTSNSTKSDSKTSNNAESGTKTNTSTTKSDAAS